MSRREFSALQNPHKDFKKKVSASLQKLEKMTGGHFSKFLKKTKNTNFIDEKPFYYRN